MSGRDPVPVVRRFSAIGPSSSDSDERQIQAVLGFGSLATWEQIDEGYRSVILAEAGAGKTFEMKARATHVEANGQLAFFIRIEDIEEDFVDAFEVGDAETFEQWLGGHADAWFYLDSIDEARLENPRTFEKAIRRFSRAIKDAQHRAHVCVSSRPYAWRPKTDRELIQHYLPLPRPRSERTGQDGQITDTSEFQDALSIFVLVPLAEQDIRLFAQHRSVQEVERLIGDLERLDLLTLAGRPFDLEGILDKWASDRALGGISELLRHNVEMRLKESHHPDGARRRPLNLNKAMDGASRLAAAVVLTGDAGIQVPDSDHSRTGIDAAVVLADWEPDDIQTLLERGIFDDVIYGAVRFRHRDVRELLAADWFIELLQRGHSRHEIEALFFREQYEQQTISRRLRVVLPWLILEDGEIRARTLAEYPDVALEGGDPARLPLPVRQRILSDVVGRIVQGEDSGSKADNRALARIAATDLTDQASALIDQCPDNDDVLFFLGRLVWQGAMSGCVPRLIPVATDPARGIYVRIAATLAIATCGNEEQRGQMWDILLAADDEIPRELLAELIKGAPVGTTMISNLLEAIDKLPPHEPFKMTGLTSAVHGIVDDLPLSGDAQPLRVLIEGFEGLLHRPPSIQPESCHISEEFSWLLGPATHAVERLIEARVGLAFDEHTLAILCSAPSARDWRDHGIGDRKDRLGELVPSWPELNDVLFWHTVEARRTALESEGKVLNDDWPVQWPNHYWTFGSDDFTRVLGWVRTRVFEDDRLLALSLAFRIYGQSEQPTEWVDQLRDSVAGEPVLVARLDELMNGATSSEVLKWHRQQEERERRLESKRKDEAQRRLDWIVGLKADPERVRHPPRLGPGDFTGDQYGLLREIEDDERTSRSHGANWQVLTEDFGEDVARAYCDAAKAHWRHCRPELRSEGGDNSSVAYSLIFGLVGIAIEAEEVDEFPTHLSASDVRLALRYVFLELNGFPSWLEAMYQERPDVVVEVIGTELFWELDNTEPDRPMHYVLHDVAVYAPWLHRALVEPLLGWIRSHDLPSDGAFRHSLRILRGGEVDPSDLLAVAKHKATSESVGHRASWYAIWVDVEPDTGVNAVASWLDGLGREDGSHSAQLFVTALLGSHGAERVAYVGGFLTPAHLKSLYVLMHRHIQMAEDIDRSGGGAYSPGLRDNAQDARDRLFGLLSEIPGKATYVALAELIQEHPNPSSRLWMAKRARERAEQDGDLEPWTARQISEFGAQLTRTPTSQRQLFDLAVARVTDLKNWLERGNDSPYRIWQKADRENDIRILVAGWLNQNWRNRLTVAQEPELANSQRMDIWLQEQNVPTPVPIELKLLDKRWSGPQLCERLRNQLAGDYLREETGGFGLMLLVWSGDKPGRRWRIDGRLVSVDGLREAMKRHWASHSHSFPNVEAVEVVVIDLTLRAQRSGLEAGVKSAGQSGNSQEQVSSVAVMD